MALVCSWRDTMYAKQSVAGVCCDAHAAAQATGAHLFQTDPSANFFDYKAMAIGARSQSAKTYLEKHFPEFEACTNALFPFSPSLFSALFLLLRVYLTVSPPSRVCACRVVQRRARS
jgi:hypothetical protein